IVAEHPLKLLTKWCELFFHKYTANAFKDSGNPLVLALFIGSLCVPRDRGQARFLWFCVGQYAVHVVAFSFLIYTAGGAGDRYQLWFWPIAYLYGTQFLWSNLERFGKGVQTTVLLALVCYSGILSAYEFV